MTLTACGLLPLRADAGHRTRGTIASRCGGNDDGEQRDLDPFLVVEQRDELEVLTLVWVRRRTGGTVGAVAAHEPGCVIDDPGGIASLDEEDEGAFGVAPGHVAAEELVDGVGELLRTVPDLTGPPR